MKRTDFFGADVHDDAEVRRQYNLLIEQMDFSTRYLKLNYGIRDHDQALARRHGTMNAAERPGRRHPASRRINPRKPQQP